jgi:hypothetical protein
MSSIATAACSVTIAVTSCPAVFSRAASSPPIAPGPTTPILRGMVRHPAVRSSARLDRLGVRSYVPGHVAAGHPRHAEALGKVIADAQHVVDRRQPQVDSGKGRSWHRRRTGCRGRGDPCGRDHVLARLIAQAGPMRLWRLRSSTTSPPWSSSDASRSGLPEPGITGVTSPDELARAISQRSRPSWPVPGARPARGFGQPAPRSGSRPRWQFRFRADSRSGSSLRALRFDP